MRAKSKPPSEPLAVVVGRNCKRIRSDAGVTQNVLAKHGRDVGLRWNASKVGQFERGQYAPTLGTVLAASIALSSATKTDVTPADLVEFDGLVEFNDDWSVMGRKVSGALRGEPWGVLLVGDTGLTLDEQLPIDLAERMKKAFDGPRRYGKLLIADIGEVQRRSGLDEERLAKRLGIDFNLLSQASVYLWGRSFSDQRDRLAGPDANAQKRGRVSRKLQQEIEEELARGDD